MVVLVPGGSWVSADPSGLAPLGEALAKSGFIAATISYRTSAEDAFFPVPAGDISCGIAHAVASASSAGHNPSEIVVLGHSAGAHLAALVALRGEALHENCNYRYATVDRMIGLAGPYNIEGATQAASPLFAEDATPDDWIAANPVAHTSARPEVPFLLIHGSDDTVVPISFTDQFAAALAASGHLVTVEFPGGVDHNNIYTPLVVLDPIVIWLGEDH